ncbi:MAG: hypothetical protein ACI9VR_003665, partial [Cognaticolwellia sp.]
DAILGVWILVFVLFYWLQRGAKPRTLLSIVAGLLLSAPLTLPAFGAWMSGEGTAAQIWPEGLYWLGLVPLVLGAACAWPNESGRRWLGAGVLALGLAFMPLLFGAGSALSALMAVALWMLAVAVGFAVHHRVPERAHAGAGALVLVLGVLCCGPLRAMGQAPPTLAGALPMGPALPTGRTLGLEGVPLMQAELRGAPLWPSVQALRFAAMLDQDSEHPGLWVGSVNAQNRKVLEFAGVRSVVAEGELFGLALLGVQGRLSLYALEGGALEGGALEGGALEGGALEGGALEGGALEGGALEGGPRAWLTPGGRPAANEREALDFLRTGYAFRQAPAIQALKRRLPTEGEITPLVVEDLGGTVRIPIPVGADSGVLVLADRWEPEWRVQVDGQDADLLQVGGLFRGVILPPGAEEVVFEYRLWTWGWGLGLGAIGLLLTLAQALRRRPE